MATRTKHEEEPGLVDIPTASRLLGGLGESTLRRWIAGGRVSVVRLGRRVLLRREALEELIRAGESRAASEIVSHPSATAVRRSQS